MPSRNERLLRFRTQVEFADPSLSGRRRRRRRSGRLPRPGSTRALERQYAREILRMTYRPMEEELRTLLEELPTLLSTAEEDRSRFDAGEGGRIRSLLARARERLRGILAAASPTRIIERVLSSTSDMQLSSMQRQMRSVLGVDVFVGNAGLRSLLEQSTQENVALIQSLPDRTLSEIETLVMRGVNAGTRHEDLAKQIERRFQVGRNRAKLIARDQVLKFHGKVAEHRQRSLGVERFIWRTANDQRVRPEHAAREGKTYTWDNAPEGGPGQPINCRCYAEPVLDDVLGD